jgi:hypothetical protein
VVALAGRHAQMFQFTGLTHGADGAPGAGGFALDQVIERSRWLSEAAAGRDGQIERSCLVQVTGVGSAASTPAELAERFELDEDVIETTPFVLSGSVEQIVDKIGRQRDQLGISHYVVRDPEGFAPVVDALAAVGAG